MTRVALLFVSVVALAAFLAGCGAASDSAGGTSSAAERKYLKSVEAACLRYKAKRKAALAGHDVSVTIAKIHRERTALIEQIRSLDPPPSLDHTASEFAKALVAVNQLNPEDQKSADALKRAAKRVNAAAVQLGAPRCKVAKAVVVGYVVAVPEPGSAATSMGLDAKH